MFDRRRADPFDFAQILKRFQNDRSASFDDSAQDVTRQTAGFVNFRGGAVSEQFQQRLFTPDLLRAAQGRDLLRGETVSGSK